MRFLSHRISMRMELTSHSSVPGTRECLANAGSSSHQTHLCSTSNFLSLISFPCHCCGGQGEAGFDLTDSPPLASCPRASWMPECSGGPAGHPCVLYPEVLGDSCGWEPWGKCSPSLPPGEQFRDAVCKASQGFPC